MLNDITQLPRPIELICFYTCFRHRHMLKASHSISNWCTYVTQRQSVAASIYCNFKGVLFCPFYEVLIWFLGCKRIKLFIIEKLFHFFLYTYFTILLHLSYLSVSKTLFQWKPFQNTKCALIGKLAQCIVIGEPLRACSGNVNFWKNVMCLAVNVNNGVNFAIQIQAWFSPWKC